VSRFHVLRSGTSFCRYRGRRVPFSCFALPDTFSAVRRASGPIFMFCTPELIFGGIESIGSRFHLLRCQTRFSWYCGRRVTFSFFDLPDSLSAVQSVPSSVFKFCNPRVVSPGTEGVGSRFYVLRAQTCFWRSGGRRVPFSCFARLDSFSAVRRAAALVFMFCVPGLVSHGTEGVGSRFHVLRSQTRFRRYRGRLVPFSCFARPDSFSAVPRVSRPVFMF
jgi:hypothetical protein